MNFTLFKKLTSKNTNGKDIKSFSLERKLYPEQKRITTSFLQIKRHKNLIKDSQFTQATFFCNHSHLQLSTMEQIVLTLFEFL